MSIILDEMTPLERMTAFIQGKPYDRVPCCPFLEENFSMMFGYSLSDYHTSRESNTDITIQTYRMFKPDSIGVSPGLHGLPEAMGCKVNIPKYRTPYIEEPAIKSYSELSGLELINPKKDGRLPMFNESLLRVRDVLGNEVSVDTLIGGPFTTAAFIRGTEQFLKDLRTNPEDVHKLLEITTANTIAYIDHIISLGFVPSIPEPIASSTLISKKNFEIFVQPYLKRCFDHMKEKTGETSILHICGKTKPIWTNMVETGAAAISLDNVESMKELKETCGDKVTIIGNIDPVNVLLKGTVDLVDFSVKRCIKDSIDSPMGFILSSGCDVPIGTPPENVAAMIDAARRYGRMY